MKKNKGFTLIEILIVVSIIGLLSSIVLVGLGAFRGGGRDARRIADLRETQKALELFYNKNRQYPSSAGGGVPGNGGSPVVVPWSTLENLLINAGIGITDIANDPLPNQTYRYVVTGNRQGYGLSANLEDSDNPALREDIDGDLHGIDCDDPAYCIQF